MKASLYFCLSAILLISVDSCSTKGKETFNQDAQKVENSVKSVVDTVRNSITNHDTSAGSDSGRNSGSVSSHEVTLDEYTIDMDESIKAGNEEFKVSNHGKMDHNFEIYGNGVRKSFTPNLQPDETRVMKITLRPGTYEVYCPLDNHENKGMKAKLTVTQ